MKNFRLKIGIELKINKLKINTVLPNYSSLLIIFNLKDKLQSTIFYPKKL